MKNFYNCVALSKLSPLGSLDKIQVVNICSFVNREIFREVFGKCIAKNLKLHCSVVEEYDSIFVF